MFDSNSCRITDKLEIEIPALARPTIEEIREKYPWIRSIKYDNSPVKPVTLVLGTVARSGEIFTTVTEHQERLRSVNGILGYQHAVWILANKDKFLDGDYWCSFSKEFRFKIYMEFSGIRVIGNGGFTNERYPCLVGDDKNIWMLVWFGIHWHYRDLTSSDSRIALDAAGKA
jgi:hypothetical protein